MARPCHPIDQIVKSNRIGMISDQYALPDSQARLYENSRATRMSGIGSIEMYMYITEYVTIMWT